MTTRRLFFKLHNGFPEHPKTIELSDKAFRQLIETWCFCSRTLNDGNLTKTQFFRFFSSKSRGEVIKHGFVDETDSGYVMHGYLEDQQSAEHVSDVRQRRKEAGAKGGRAKAEALANSYQIGKQKGSKPLPDTDTDTDVKNPTYVGVLYSPSVTGTPRNDPGRTGTRIPANFTATAEMIRWAQDNTPNVNIALATQKFKAHHRSVAGKSQFKTDWTAAWEAWLLSDQQRANNRPQQFTTGRERKRVEADVLIAKFAAEEGYTQTTQKELTS